MGGMQPKVMKWARETAGLSLHAAAHALGLKGENGVARLAAIEGGTKEPSRPLLLKLVARHGASKRRSADKRKPGIKE